jgi:hypothetical protein
MLAALSAALGGDAGDIGAAQVLFDAYVSQVATEATMQHLEQGITALLDTAPTQAAPATTDSRGVVRNLNRTITRSTLTAVRRIVRQSRP